MHTQTHTHIQTCTKQRVAHRRCNIAPYPLFQHNRLKNLRVKRLCLAYRLFSAMMLPTFSMAQIHSGKRLLHCYLVKPVRAVRSGAIFVHAHRWCCYLRVRLHCKPLRRGEICCFYSLAPLCQQRRLMPPTPHPPNTPANSQHIIEKTIFPVQTISLRLPSFCYL